MASNNQFFSDEWDLRDCGFIPARLEVSFGDMPCKKQVNIC